MRLIERLRRWAAECDRTNFGCQARAMLLEAADALEKAPTINAVPVVRCKDCRIGKPSDTFGDGWVFCKNNQQVHQATHFCGYGERKDGEG